MQLLKKITSVLLIINIILGIAFGTIFFLSPGMAPVLGLIFSIAVFFTIVILIWLYKIDLKNTEQTTTAQKVQLGVIVTLSVLLIGFSLQWIGELPKAVRDAKNHQTNKQKVERFLNDEAPIENGVWKYERWDNTIFNVPCKNGEIDGRAIIDEESGFVTNKFYNQGRLDSIIVYTDFAIFEKVYFDEKTKMQVRYEYSANYQELIDLDTTVTLLKK